MIKTWLERAARFACYRGAGLLNIVNKNYPATAKNKRRAAQKGFLIPSPTLQRGRGRDPPFFMRMRQHAYGGRVRE